MNIERTIANLKGRGFDVSFFKTGEEAVDYLAGEVKNTIVGAGGSVTLQSLDVIGRLAENNEIRCQWSAKYPASREESSAARVYLTSANAVAETGEIINIDGLGNRVASTLFDKDAVYFIIGTNKIAEDYDAALWRARNIAAPKNAKRLGCKTPCAERADKCYDCRSPERICNGLVVMWGKMRGVKKMEVVIIDQELGL